MDYLLNGEVRGTLYEGTVCSVLNLIINGLPSKP